MLSAQTRKREYWFNWEAEQPEDKNISFQDIKDTDYEYCKKLQQKSQPPYVYHCGIQQLEPYRQQERKPYTREELQELYNTKIEAQTIQWGADHYYTRLCGLVTEINLKSFDEGKVVEIYREQYAEDGEQYEKYYYSDGTSVKCWLGLND